MKKLGLMILVLSVGLSAGAILSQATSVGETAPAFTLVDINQKSHSLSDYEGKYVVLEWTNYDCPFVKKHYNSGNMQRLQKEYTSKGVIWLSINSSAHGNQGHYHYEDWARMVKEKDSQSTAVLLDGDGVVGRQYGAKTTPHLFVINPEGRLIYKGAIDDKPSTNPADVKTAKNYVTAALDEAMAGKDVSVSSTQSYGCSVKY